MGLGDQLKGFLKKQFIDVIHWTEPEDGHPGVALPMQDMEIQNGAKLTVRESQHGAVRQRGPRRGCVRPGLYTLNTQTLPLLTNLMNWDKLFQSPFKSDVYFFSTRQQLAQRWGTTQPVTIRDKDFRRDPAARLWHLLLAHRRSARVPHQGERHARAVPRRRRWKRSCGTPSCSISRTASRSRAFRFWTWPRTWWRWASGSRQSLTPLFAEMGIALDTLVVENLSLPEELQKRLDERIGMNMIGNMQQYTQFQAAQALPIAAANEGGGVAGLGVGLGAGLGLGQVMAGRARGPAGRPAAAAAGTGPDGRSAGAAARGSRGSRRRRGGRRGCGRRGHGGGNQVLPQLRRQDRTRLEVLSRVWCGAALSPLN
jgi:membrane protease subunit (stomatin/prohibitin family)